MTFLQGVVARIVASALWKGAVKLVWRLRYLWANKVDKTINKQDSEKLKTAKPGKELEDAARDRIGHI